MFDALRFEGLSFDYEAGESVFANVDFTWPAGSAWWVRSAGDRGRSTLLKLLAGLARPSSGRFLVDGRDLAELSFDDALGVRLATGYGFDHGGLLSNQSLADNLALPLKYHRLAEPAAADHRARTLLARFGLGDVGHLRPHAVTGSQRKLTCVLRAFVHEPALVLLDEPVTGLKRDAIDELARLARESFAAGRLKRLVLTGDNPLLADALGAQTLHISRTRFWTGNE